jgi:UDP-N-acetylmuramoylalanine--D-glutamate ligase
LPLPPLKVLGEHNVINFSGALEIIRDLGLDEKAALDSLRDFEPVEHRLEKVHEANGIMFINDSIATVAESTIAGIKAFKDKPIAVIVGGFDNGTANYGGLSKFITENDDVKIAIGLPDTGRLIESPKLKMVGPSMREAVKMAIDALPNGGVVLMSPAAPSFNMYKNYKERGHDFAALAKELTITSN